MKGKKTGGRKKGSLNKVTSSVKSLLADMVSRDIHSWNKRLDNMSDYDRINTLIRLNIDSVV